MKRTAKHIRAEELWLREALAKVKAALRTRDLYLRRSAIYDARQLLNAAEPVVLQNALTETLFGPASARVRQQLAHVRASFRALPRIGLPRDSKAAKSHPRKAAVSGAATTARTSSPRAGSAHRPPAHPARAIQPATPRSKRGFGRGPSHSPSKSN
jgi:hypothetical protein